MTDASSGFTTLIYEADGPVATITLNRPDALNSLTVALKTELLAALRRAGRDPTVRAIILTGAGRAFCAGQDLREGIDGEAAPLGDELRERYNPIVLAMRRLEKPIIGAINGVAAGAGASLAFACDLRLAAEGASFVLAFSRVGLVPDSGATWLLPRLVGLARAQQLTLLEAPLPAAEAERWGLVSRVVGGDALASEAQALARRLADAAPIAIALTKRALDRSLDLDFEAALEYEASLQGVAGRTADHAEGIKAFLEKRPPQFTGE